MALTARSEPDSAIGLVSKLVSTLRGRQIRNGLLSIISQAAISGTNFATAVIIGRLCGREELGIYYLAFSVMLAIRIFQQNLVSAPYMVYWTRREETDQRSYVGSSLVHLVILSLIASAALLGIGEVFPSGFGEDNAAFGPLLFVLALTVPFVLLREHIRFLELAHARMLSLNAVDVGMSVLQLGGLLALGLTGVLSASNSLCVIGAAAAAIVMVWLMFQAGRLEVRRARVLPDWHRNWSFGKWALTGHLIGGSAPLLMPWITAVELGADSTGLLGACVSLIGISNVFLTGMGNYVSPHAARTYTSGGARALAAFLLKAGLVSLAAIGVFCLFVILVGEPLLVAIFGDRYGQSQTILTLLALSTLARGVGLAAGAGIWAVDCPRANVYADLCILVVMLGTAWWLIEPWGVAGIAAATCVSAVLGAVVRIATVRYLIRRDLVRNG